MRALLLALALTLATASTALAHPGHDHAPSHQDSVREVQVDFAQIVADGSPPAAVATPQLPVTHCGPVSPTTDDTANAAHAANLPQFKLVYAYASDRPNRYEQWRNTLQANISLIERFVANESGGRKAPRFDMGTEACGADYVDIQVVALPGTFASYDRNFSAVQSAVNAALNPSPGGKRNILIFADRMNGSTLLSGQGALHQAPYGDREDAGNPHNNGAYTSIIWVPDTHNPPVDQSQGYWPEGFLHEMGHNMGAVQWSAPHTSRSLINPDDYTYSHCWDGHDVMCYADGPNMGHAYETNHCPALPGAMPQVFDCGRDDYFNPTPSSPSHFDDHWNTYDSVFLAECVELGKACGREDTSTKATTLPSVGGAVKGFGTATAADGAWTNTPALSRQWQREVAGDWVDIAGETGTSLALPDAWAGTHVRVRVTATTATETAVANSLPVKVANADLPVAPAAVPAPTGTLERGEILTAQTGTWQGASSFSYQWYRYNGATATWDPIAGATAATYRLDAADVGTWVLVLVQGNNSGGWVSESSDYVGAIGAGRAPLLVSAPTVSGTARSGQQLTTTDGTWDRQVQSYAYQWQRNVSGTWSDISGATAAAYTLTNADVGLTVRARVIPTGYVAQGLAAFTAATATIDASDPPANTSAPTVTGTAKQGQQLTGSAGTWVRATTVTQQWQRNAGGTWSDISGATGLNYTPTGDDVGATLRLLVTATNAAGSVTAASDPTAVVAAIQPPTVTTAPVVSGTAKRTHQLTSTAGVFGGATSTSLKWQRSNAAGTGWDDIPGATGANYTLTADDVGRKIRTLATATNADGSTPSASSETATVADLAPPTVTTAPVVSGTAKRTHQLTSTAGTFFGAVTQSLKWQRSNAAGTGWDDIAGATDANYTLTADDVGRKIRTLATATNADGSTQSASNETATVADLAPPTVTTAPVVSGTAKRTHQLTSTAGVFAGAASTSLKWQRSNGTGWDDIAGATGTGYTLTADDVGHKVRTVASGTNADGSTESASNETATVADVQLPVAGTAPVVSGTAKRTHQLTSTDGTFTGASSQSLRWQRSNAAGTGWADIAGATGGNYTLTADDVGRKIRTVATGTNADGSVESASNETATVADLAAPTVTTAPAVSGTAKRGRELTSTAGAFSGATSTSLRWQRSNATGWDDIAGATGPNYTVTADDVGRKIRTLATATNDDGSTQSASNETAAVELDPADTAIADGPSGTSTATSAEFTFTSTPSGASFECKLDSGAWAACSSPKSYSSLAVGSHTFSVRATTALDGADQSPATRTWTVSAPAVVQPAPQPQPEQQTSSPPATEPKTEPVQAPVTPVTQPAQPKVACAGLTGAKLASCKRAETLKKALAKCNKLTGAKNKKKRALCIKKAKALHRCSVLKGKKKTACIKKAKAIKASRRAPDAARPLAEFARFLRGLE